MFDMILRTLRDDGWTVAAHNDYQQDGESFTFWLLTHPDGRYVQGEGRTDTDALDRCFAMAAKTFMPPPIETPKPDGERSEGVDAENPPWPNAILREGRWYPMTDEQAEKALEEYKRVVYRTPETAQTERGE